MHHAENIALRRANTLNIHLCRQMGASPDILQQWEFGVILEGHEGAPAFFMDDYPSVRDHPTEAALEMDRLTAEGRIHWYVGDSPQDLDICPSNLITKSARLRLVHDWTRAGLNDCLVSPPSSPDTMDKLLGFLRPNS